MFGKNKPEAEAAADRQRQKTTDNGCTAGFRGVPDDGKHTADYRVFSFAADNRQADNGFRFFQFFRFFRFFSVFSVFRFFRVFQTTGKHTTGFGFSAEFRNLQQIYFRSSEGSGGDLIRWNEDKQAASSGSSRTGPSGASSRRVR